MDAVGYTPYGPRDGFAQLVFLSAEKYYIQIPDATELIIDRFVQLDTSDHDVIEVDESYSARVGDSLHFCFVWNGDVTVGSLASISPTLARAYRELDDQAVSLQIAELIGTSGEVEKERDRIKGFYGRDLGVQAQQSFVRASVFPDIVWRSLIQAVQSPSLAKVAAAHRNWILHSSSPDIQDIFPPRLAQWLEAELGVNSKLVAESVRRAVGSPQSRIMQFDPSDVVKSLRAVSAHGRQELRFLELLRIVIEQPLLGERMLEQFSDIGRFANNAATLLKANKGRIFPEVDEAFLHWYANQLISMAYPQRRGVVIQDMAEVLGHLAPVASAIEQRMNRSTAMVVRERSKAISAALYGDEVKQLDLKF
ncbi:MAG: hypothetical protein JWM94_1407 [Sphingomonas bacterium]|nr:hypothetical protein [Sphingomonas bacterium]